MGSSSGYPAAAIGGVPESAGPTLKWDLGQLYLKITAHRNESSIINPPTIHSNRKWSHSGTWNNSNDGLAYTPSILTYPERCKKGDGSLCIWLLGIPWPKISQRLLHPWEYNRSL